MVFDKRERLHMQDNFDRVADTVDEYCDAVRIGRTLFYKEVKAKRIKILKAGRKTLVPRSERQAYLERLAADIEAA